MPRFFSFTRRELRLCSETKALGWNACCCQKGGRLSTPLPLSWRYFWITLLLHNFVVFTAWAVRRKPLSPSPLVVVLNGTRFAVIDALIVEIIKAFSWRLNLGGWSVKSQRKSVMRDEVTCDYSLLKSCVFDFTMVIHITDSAKRIVNVFMEQKQGRL